MRITFEGILNHFAKGVKSQKVAKHYKSRFVLLFLLNDRRIRIHSFDYWIRIQEAQKHVDPVDPDPQH